MTTETLGLPFSKIDPHQALHMREAPIELVQEVKKLVREAMARVRQGDVLDGKQYVVLKHSETGRIYQITDDDVTVDSSRARSVGKLDSGLYVYPGTILHSGYFHENSSGGIVVPRDPDLVNPSTIQGVRTVLPGAMAEVADQIREARILHVRR